MKQKYLYQNGDTIKVHFNNFDTDFYLEGQLVAWTTHDLSISGKNKIYTIPQNNILYVEKVTEWK